MQNVDLEEVKDEELVSAEKLIKNKHKEKV